jgi:tetratricopeptide (TPR) repeat protein
MKGRTCNIFGTVICLILCVCASKSDQNISVQPQGLSTGNLSVKSTTPTPIPTVLSQEICDNQRAKAYVLSKSDRTLDEAISKYKSLIDSGCYSDDLYLQYAYLLSSTDDYEGASKQYRIVIEHNPKSWYAHWSLAQILIMKLAHYEEGLHEVEISRKLDSGRDIGFIYDFYMGRAFEGLGKYDEAIKHYEIYVTSASRITNKNPQLIEAEDRLSKLRTKLGSH